MASMAASAILPVVMKTTGMRVDEPDLLIDLQSGLVGQAQVEENDIRRLGWTRSSPATPVPAISMRWSGAGKLSTNLSRDQGQVIVDEQNVGHGSLTSGASGRERPDLRPARTTTDGLDRTSPIARDAAQPCMLAEGTARDRLDISAAWLAFYSLSW